MEARLSKRIVLLLPNGMHKILGSIDETPPDVLSTEPFISLVKVTTRAAYYKVIYPETP
jgi:hypothetical protein